MPTEQCGGSEAGNGPSLPATVRAGEGSAQETLHGTHGTAGEGIYGMVQVATARNVRPERGTGAQGGKARVP